MGSICEFADASSDPPVRGFLHEPANPGDAAIVLTHGAGGNCSSKLLVALAGAFVEVGFLVLRCNLPFRQERPYGPPSPWSAERDREGLRRAVTVMKQKISGPIFLGGHSYGGRQASMLAAAERNLVAGLLLLSYPLHPPRRAEQLRTAHFPGLFSPAVFVHGSRDPFASSEEMNSALALIPAPHQLLEIEAAGHELLKGKTANADELARSIVSRFKAFISS